MRAYVRESLTGIGFEDFLTADESVSVRRLFESDSNDMARGYSLGCGLGSF